MKVPLCPTSVARRAANFPLAWRSHSLPISAVDQLECLRIVTPVPGSPKLHPSALAPFPQHINTLGTWESSNKSLFAPLIISLLLFPPRVSRWEETEGTTPSSLPAARGPLVSTCSTDAETPPLDLYPYKPSWAPECSTGRL